MSKLIIENRTDLPMEEALSLAYSVILQGRISKNDTQYCYLTSFDHNGDTIHIASSLNKGSDKLTIYKAPEVTKNN